MEVLRTFIALKLSKNIKNIVSYLLDELKAIDCHIKWTKSSNVHLTLKFLGNIPLSKINSVSEILNQIAKSQPKILTCLTTLDTFPDKSQPRIIWIGLQDKNHKIMHLASALESELEKLDFIKEERAFKPHITIGRVKTLKNINLLKEKIQYLKIPIHPEELLEQITLYKSTLTADGPLYEPLSTFSLQ